MSGKVGQDEKKAMWYLRKVSLFADLTAEELLPVAERVTLVEIRRRQVIYIPGDPSRSVYFVNGGRVKVSKVTRDGKELTLAYRGPGELFGEMALLAESPREEMAEAVENTLVTEVERELLDVLLLRSVKMGYRMVKTLIAQRRELENKIEQLIFKDVNAKLAQLLLRLAEEYGVAEDRGTLLAVKITHQEMANLIGSTRETVSLTLSQFKRKGLVDSDGRKLIVQDFEGLRAIA